MKFKYISVVLLCFVILVETVGIQIIKDMCRPCQNELITIQFAYTPYDSDCHEDCNTRENSVYEDTHCCTSEGCAQQDHEHEKEVEVYSKYPDFFNNNSINHIKLQPTLIAVLNLYNYNRLFAQQNLESFYSATNESLPPNNDKQSFLCTYII